METLILGIDDAGRGPIIGPMVLAGVLCTEKQEQVLKLEGVKDSKMLLTSTREKLAKLVKKTVKDYYIHTATPEEIDLSVGTKFNLNKLEALKMAEAINEILKKTDLKKNKVKIYIDCPSNNISEWKRELKKHIEKEIVNSENVEIIAEHKADVNHPSVSAASILAKTTRDNEIECIKKRIGRDFGSGYPSDPITMEFLKECSTQYEHDGIFRKSWMTWKNHNGEKRQKKLGEF